MVTLPSLSDSLIEKAIATPGGEFTLLLKSPTYRDRLEDDSRSMLAFAGDDAARVLASQQIHRIQRCCVGWSGVQDAAGVPVVFSLDQLGNLLTAWPAAADQVTKILQDLFSPPESLAGESVSKPAVGSAAAV